MKYLINRKWDKIYIRDTNELYMPFFMGVIPLKPDGKPYEGFETFEDLQKAGCEVLEEENLKEELERINKEMVEIFWKRKSSRS